MSFFKQRGMLLVRIFEVIYAPNLALASANIHKIKMEKSKLRDFFTKKNIKSFLGKRLDIITKTSGCFSKNIGRNLSTLNKKRAPVGAN